MNKIESPDYNLTDKQVKLEEIHQALAKKGAQWEQALIAGDLQNSDRLEQEFKSLEIELRYVDPEISLSQLELQDKDLAETMSKIAAAKGLRPDESGKPMN